MKKETLRAAAFYLALFLGLALINLSLFNYACDDSYIHFRIAENLLHGRPYYNPGEPVMGSSSAGWTLTLFLLFLLAGVKLKVVSVFNAAATTLAAYVYARVVDEAAGKRRFSHDLLVAALLTSVLIYPDVGLMETPLALLVLGVGVFLYLRKNGLSFVLLGMSVFFRPELIVFLILFLGFNLHARVVPIRRSFLYSMLGAAPLIAYDYAFFGTLIPLPAIAKGVVYQLSRADVLDTGTPRFFLDGLSGLMAEAVLLLMLFYITLRMALKCRRGPGCGVPALLLSGGALIFLAYFFEKVKIDDWYAPLYAAPFFLSSLIYAVKEKNRVLGVFLLLAFLPFGAGLYDTAYAAARDRYACPHYYFEGRVGRYLEVGRRLYERYPDCTLMASEIGGLGFAFKGKIYDSVGLVSPGALRYQPMKVPEQRLSGQWGCIPAGYAAEKRPDIIVSIDRCMDRRFPAGFLDKYVMIKEDIYEPEEIDMLREKGMIVINRLLILIRKDRYRGF